MRLLDECDEPRKSYDLLGQLFVEMNTPGKTPGGRHKGVDYFNGSLFADQPVMPKRGCPFFPSRKMAPAGSIRVNAATNTWTRSDQMLDRHPHSTRDCACPARSAPRPRIQVLGSSFSMSDARNALLIVLTGVVL
jgi:hypothetical protein